MSPFEWIFTEGADVDFGQADAVEITGFPASKFQNWANRGIANHLSSGIGTRRRYTAQTLVIMSIASALQDLNITAASSMMTASNIWIEAMRDLTKMHKKRETRWSEFALTVAVIRAESDARHNIFVTMDPTKLPTSDLVSGHPCIVFAVGPVVERIAVAAMASLSTDEVGA